MFSNTNPPPYSPDAAPSAPPAYSSVYMTVSATPKVIDWDSMPTEIVSHAKEAHAVLQQYGMENHEARIKVILDVSGSMQKPNQFFQHPEKGNRVQALLNKALALAFLFDDNASVEIIPFGDRAFPEVSVTEDNFRNATDRVLESIGGSLRPSTNYADAIRALRKNTFNDAGNRHKELVCEDDPVFAIFVTDGEPNAEKTQAVNEFISTSFTATFVKILALQGHEENFEFLNQLDSGEHGKMHVDNVDLVTLKDPNDLTMELLIREYRPWLEEVFKKKMLTNDPKITPISENAEGHAVLHKQSMFGKKVHHKKRDGHDHAPAAPSGQQNRF